MFHFQDRPGGTLALCQHILRFRSLDLSPVSTLASLGFLACFSVLSISNILCPFGFFSVVNAPLFLFVLLILALQLFGNFNNQAVTRRVVQLDLR